MVSESARPRRGDFKMPATTFSPASSMGRNDNQDTWSVLEAGVDRMMTRLTEGLDMATYMKLYTAVHNFCTSQKGVNQGAAAAQNLASQKGGW